MTQLEYLRVFGVGKRVYKVTLAIGHIAATHTTHVHSSSAALGHLFFATQLTHADVCTHVSGVNWQHE